MLHDATYLFLLPVITCSYVVLHYFHGYYINDVFKNGSLLLHDLTQSCALVTSYYM